MDENEINSYKKAGEIASEVVKFSKNFIKPKMLLVEIAEKIESKIEEVGGKPAFPVNLSLNEIAAHYTPSSDDETKAEGLLKIDLGVSVEGYIADVAFSLDLTEDGQFKEMIEANEEVLEMALGIVRPKMKIKEIGNVIHEKVEDYNKTFGKQFSIIKNLSGHSLGKDMIHAGVTISNCKNNNENELDDIAIAIEPFLTTGKGEVYEGKPSEIFMLQSEKRGGVRDNDARELLKFIKENYKTKPFCRRWLKKQEFKKLDFLLSILIKHGVLHNFPILVEKSKKPVSQAEHTVFILKDGVEIITK